MTEPEAEYGDRLRRALHAAADGVVPSGDGLERIRSRIAREPATDSLGLLVGWLRSIALEIRAGMPDVRAVLPALRSVLEAMKTVLEALKTTVVPALRSVLPVVTAMVVAAKSRVPERLRISDGWMRPVLATAGAVFIAFAAVLAIPGLRQNIIPTGSSGPNPAVSQPGGA
jgi:hypothetical protein